MSVIMINAGGFDRFEPETSVLATGTTKQNDSTLTPICHSLCTCPVTVLVTPPLSLLVEMAGYGFLWVSMVGRWTDDGLGQCSVGGRGEGVKNCVYGKRFGLPIVGGS